MDDEHPRISGSCRHLRYSAYTTATQPIALLLYQATTLLAQGNTLSTANHAYLINNKALLHHIPSNRRRPRHLQRLLIQANDPVPLQRLRPAAVGAGALRASRAAAASPPPTPPPQSPSSPRPPSAGAPGRVHTRKGQ